jgi:tripartite-type tricarboxylate transporter receptor subunit TctC
MALRIIAVADTQRSAPSSTEAPMWVDAASGQVNAGIGIFQSFSPLYEKGALRTIAVNTSTRSPKLPAVPTLAEQGFTDRILAL